MFNPSRDQVREFFFHAWANYQAKQTLTDLEKMAIAHVLQHPEYHALLNQPERYREREWPPELGETNPFLHLAMHLSIDEQLSIDQPAGVRAAYAKICAKLGDEHPAQHAVMDCLGEMIWRAQRDQQPPDGAAYVRCIEDKTTK